MLIFYRFEGKPNTRLEIGKFIKYRYNDPHLAILVRSMNDDSNQSMMDTTTLHSSLNISFDTTISNKIIPPEEEQLQNSENQQKNKKHKKKTQKKKNSGVQNQSTELPASSELSEKSTSVNVPDENLVRITHVKSPDHFYIQKVIDLQHIRQLSHSYLDYRSDDHIPRQIGVGDYYMVYHTTDKQWYRSLVKKILPNELYRVFLVDFGMNLDISKDK